MFANDTSIYQKTDSLYLLQRTVSKELKTMKILLDMNKLSLNSEKTNLIIVTSPQRFINQVVSIKMGNFIIRKACLASLLMQI